MAEGGASQAKAWRGHEPRRPWELKEHEIECERRYGEINSSIARFDVLQQRNTRLLYLILAGMLTVVAHSFWPVVFGG